MDLTAVLLLAVLFIAGLINIFFIIPTNKICAACLQIFFPNKNNINNNASSKSNYKTNSNNDNNASSSPPPQPPATTTTKNKEELRKVFSTFDKNGDGFITRQELKESLRNIRIFMSDKDTDDLIAKFDSNGDGLIDFEEFCLLTSESQVRVRGRSSEGEEKESVADDEFLEDDDEEEVNLKEAFDVFDKDKDGVISVEELALVLNSLGLREGKRIQECKEMIRKVDMDGDGMVNFDEFKRMMMNGGKLFLAA